MKKLDMEKLVKEKINLPASFAHIWAKCGGSLLLRKSGSIFDDSNSAQLGILTHRLAVEKNTDKLTSEQFQLYSDNKDTIDEYLKFYKDNLNYLFSEFKKETKDKNCIFAVENSLRVEKPGFYIQGPPDAFFVSRRAQQLIVVDLKTGFAEVSAKNNAQLTVYAHVIAEVYKLQNPEMLGVIIQPPLSQFDKADIYYDKQFFDRITPNTSEFTVGSHCVFCPAKQICVTFQDKLKTFLTPEYRDYTLARDAHWPELLSIASAAVNFFESVRSDAFKYLQSGGAIPGWGIGQKAGQRCWTQEVTDKKISKTLGIDLDTLHDKKLKSVAKVEKILKETKSKKLSLLSSLYYQPQVQTLKQIETETTFRRLDDTQKTPARQVKTGKNKIK